MRKVVAGLFLAVIVMWAADASGKWSGTTTALAGETTGAYFEFKQSGASLTGTGGPAADKQWPISKGKAEGNKLTFEVAMPAGGAMQFDLTLTGDKIEGDMTLLKNGERVETSRISVGRVK